MPPALARCTWNLPSVTVARYVTIGRDSFQTNVVRPPAVRCASSRPLPTAVSPAGTLIRTVYVVLSFGVSLDGNQPGEPWGSPTTNAPSFVGTKPSMESSGSVITFGTPPYATVTRKGRPRRSGVAGVIFSS